MHVAVRGGVAAVATLIFLGGIVGLAAGGQATAAGSWALIVGGAGILAVTLERGRYRSEQAEHASAPTGPGGGETDGPLEGRFQRTAELFVDPTTGHRMRVWIDPTTGERRYRAEG
jgi:hypothetical protein